MRKNIMNINKTKYRYFMDNLRVFPIRTIMTYTVPVPKDFTKDEKNQEFFDRNYPKVSITNLHMKNMIDKTAKALIAYGIKKGDVVTICHTNTPEVFYMDYALSKIGAVPNYIYPNITSDEMKYYIEELSSKYVFVLDDSIIKENLKKAIKGKDIKVISSSPIESFPYMFKYIAGKKQNDKHVKLNNEILWKDFIKNGKKINNVVENKYEPNSIACYIHTSGTSNVPKAVMMSNENINCIPRNYELDNIIWQSHKKAVQTIPEFVSYGITTNHLYFCNNVNVVLIPEMEPKNLYDLFNKFKPEYCFTTPSHARELIKRPTDMSRSKMIVFGGDGFDDVELSMNKYMKDNGSSSVAYQGYGSTEMSAVTMTNAPGRHKIGSLGKLSGETKAVIIKPGTLDEISKPNEIGELCLTGPGVTLGYAGNSKEESQKVYVKHDDGKVYVHMGDYISRDEDDFFYYHGRIKNVITRKSFTFSPDEIVNAVLKHPNVKQCIVVPRYSKEEGETPSCHITLNDYNDKRKTLDEIVGLVNQNVQEFHRPTDYKIREEIIRTRNNKNNLTALKIEDTASMYDGVFEANIIASNDGECDYYLDLRVDSNYQDINLEKNIIEYINKISNIIKFNPGKIKVRIEYVDLKYIDQDLEYEKSKKYVKHI